MENKQKSIELCNLGIAQKRIGNFEKALQYYEEARQFCKTNQEIYYNTAKVLIGLGEYSLAFKNIMTYSHLKRLTSDTGYFQNNIFMTSLWIDAFDNYLWEDEITENFSISKDELYSLKFQLASQYSVVLDFNSCFLAGLCFILEDSELVKFHKLENNLIVNTKDALLGQLQKEGLKNCKYENLINACGLYFILNNYILFKNNLEQVSEIYFSEAFKIDRNIIQIKKRIPGDSKNLSSINDLTQEIIDLIKSEEEKMQIVLNEFNNKNYQKTLMLIDNILIDDPYNAKAYMLRGKSNFYLIGFPKDLEESISNLNLENPGHFGFLSNNFFFGNDETYNYLVEARKNFITLRTLDIEQKEVSSKFIKEIDEWLELYNSYIN